MDVCTNDWFFNFSIPLQKRAKKRKEKIYVTDKKKNLLKIKKYQEVQFISNLWILSSLHLSFDHNKDTLLDVY